MTRRSRVRIPSGRPTWGVRIAVQQLEGREVPASFAPQPTVTGGLSFPTALVAADFNGDGFGDFAVIDNEVNDVVVFLGAGDGKTFALKAALSEKLRLPSDVVAADFDNDGKVDLAVANGGPAGNNLDNGLVGFRGNGDGTFALAPGTPVDGAITPDELAVADVNGDGKADVLASDFSSQLVRVYLGNGAVGFTVGTPVSAPFASRGLAAGDFDADGKQDFAVAVGSEGSGFQTSFGNGDGTFTPGVFTSTGFTTPGDLGAGDFDGDGDGDIVTLEGNSVVLHANLGNRTFAGPGVVIDKGFSTLASLAVADFDSDGRPDVVATDPFGGGGTVRVIENRGGGKFEPATGSPYPTDGSGFAVAVADFDADANPDFAVRVNGAGPNPAGVQPFLNTSLDATTTALASAPNPSQFSRPVTFTATVAPVGKGGATPTGTVLFREAGVVIGSAPVGPGGTAAFTTSSLSVGPHFITASYLGSALSKASGPAAVVQQVLANPTTTALLSDPNPSKFAQLVTFTAAVAPAAPDLPRPTGTVTFQSGGVAIGSAPVGPDGKAVFSTATFPVGSQSVVAVYGGDPVSAGSQSAPLVQVVGRNDTVVTLASAPNPSKFAQAVTFTAAVAPSGGDGTPPTGTVVFADAGVVIGSAPVAPDGTAVFSTAALPIGTRSVTASYSGDPLYNGGQSAPAGQVVDRNATSTTVLSIPNPSVFGQPVTITAVVSPFGGDGRPPTGTVLFECNGEFIGSAPVGPDGRAVFTSSTLPPGAIRLAAVYPGDAFYLPSRSPAISQFNDPLATAVSLAIDPNPSVFGQEVAFTATVVSAGGVTPTGTVLFQADGVTIGSAPVGPDGRAAFRTAALPVGTRNVVAVYGGSGVSQPGRSAAVPQVVGPAVTTTTLTVTPTQNVLGRPVTLTATVAVVPPGAGPFEGSVTFFDGDVPLGTVPLDLTTGTATLTTTALPAGGRTLTAVFTSGGNLASSFGNSASLPVPVDVQPPPQPQQPFLAVGSDAGAIACVFEPDGTLHFGVQANPADFSAGVRVTAADVNRDGVDDIIVGSGPGAAPRVAVYDGATREELFRFAPYEESFTAGVYVAAGDISGDGVPDIAVGTGNGGGPRVAVFDGAGAGRLADFFGIEDSNFRGGVRVGVGDIDRDGRADLVVGAGLTGGPRVAVYDGRTVRGGQTPDRLLPDFFAFESSVRDGIFVSVGDVTGDGFCDIVVGAGDNGAPRVAVFDGGAYVASRTPALISTFFSGNPDNRGGVRVGVRDLDADGRAEILTGAGVGSGSRVAVFRGGPLTPAATPPLVFELDAFPNLVGGVYVG